MAALEFGLQHRPLVAAKQALDALERNRIDVPGIAADIGHMAQTTAIGRMKTVVHRRGQAQGHIHPVAIALGQRLAAQEFDHRIGRALGLQCSQPFEAAAGSHDRITGTCNDCRVGIKHPGTGHQLAGEAVMKTGKALLAGIRQIKVGKKPPGADRQPCQQRVADLAEPAHETGKGNTGYPVGQQKIQVLLQQKAVAPGRKRCRQPAPGVRGGRSPRDA